MGNKHIEIRDGVYYVPGTKVTLDGIVYAFRDGFSAESIREQYNGLTLAGVYGAISFYLDHRDDMDSYLLRRKGEWDALVRTGIPPSQDLLDRIEGGRRRMLVNQT
jgi:uncharacterized protein (DUF433 family)